jgi:hypothetical protein
VIAGKRRGVGSGGDFCARGARRLHAGKRVITLNGRGIAGTRFCTLTYRRVAGRGAADVVTLRGNRGNRRTRMRGNDAGTAQLRRVRGRRNGGMALIVVERQRRILRRHLHVLRAFLAGAVHLRTATTWKAVRVMIPGRRSNLTSARREGGGWGAGAFHRQGQAA